MLRWVRWTNKQKNQQKLKQCRNSGLKHGDVCGLCSHQRKQDFELLPACLPTSCFCLDFVLWVKLQQTEMIQDRSVCLSVSQGEDIINCRPISGLGFTVELPVSISPSSLYINRCMMVTHTHTNTHAQRVLRTPDMRAVTQVHSPGLVLYFSCQTCQSERT